MVRETPPREGLCRKLARLAEASPDRLAYTFLVDGEGVGEELTWAEVASRATALARRLAVRHRAGDRAILVYPPGLDFVVAFYACLLAGVVAVPAYPPRRARRLHRLRSIAADCRAMSLLTTGDLAERMVPFLSDQPDLATLSTVVTDRPADRGTGAAQAAGASPLPGLDARPDAIAFLQYTSGSTAAPKGVVVTHGNLVHNQGLIAQAFGSRPDDVVVSWLPLHHDMGLIGGVLQPLWVGCRCVLMSPAAFLQRPVRWLTAIHRHGGTLSGGPDFAYRLLADRLGDDDLDGLDLTGWRVAFDGSEPVHAETLDRFARRLAPSGFARQAFFPCYGLAEATLFVSGGPAEEPPTVTAVEPRALEAGRVEVVDAEDDRDGAADGVGRLLVSSGRPAAGLEVAVVDPESRRATTGLGEIWVRGPSVAAGYFRATEQTAEAFGGRRADEPEGGEPWLRTGDLGFLRGGELTVTGRSKELIILRGRNLYPQDVEASAAAAHEGIRAGAVAAFSEELDGTECLVVVAELHRHHRDADPDAVASAVRRAVLADHEAPVHSVVLIRHGTVPKTTSGKIRRRHTRELWRRGELSVEAERGTAPAQGAAEIAWIARERLREVSGTERRALLAREIGRWSRTGPGEPGDGGELGDDDVLAVDSLAALELVALLADRWGVELPVGELLAGPRLDRLAARLDELFEQSGDGDGDLGGEAGGPASPLAAALATPVERSAEVAREPPTTAPTTPGQTALWLVHRQNPDSPADHLGFAARVEPAPTDEELRAAVAALARRHPALATAIRAPEAGAAAAAPLQHPGAAPPQVTVVEVADGAAALELAAGTLHRPFDLAAGPPARVLLARPADGSPALLQVVAHHAVVDLVSLVVLVEELARLLAGHELEPAPPTFADFARWRRTVLDGAPTEALAAWWAEELDGAPTVLELPADRPRPPQRSGRGATLAFELPAAATDALRRLCRHRGATLFAGLLAGWGSLLGRLADRRDLLVAAPTSERLRSELARTVGYFTSPLPLRVRWQDEDTFGDLLAAAGETVRRALDHRSIGLAALAERLAPERDPSRTPLVQHMLTLERLAPASAPGGSGEPTGRRASLAPFLLPVEQGDGAPDGGLELAGRRFHPAPVPHPGAQMDLALTAVETGSGGLGLALTFDTALFDPTTARRLGERLVRWLVASVARPERRLAETAELSWLSPAERQQVLHEWQGEAMGRDEDTSVTSVVGAFLRRAAETPDALALQWHAGAATERRWSYRELARAATGVARKLAAVGVRRGDRVAVAVPRGPELVASLLGVMAAGAAYVPVDPAYPPARTALVLGDSGARALLLGDRLAAPPSCEGPVLRAEEVVGGELDGESSVAPDGSPAAEDLAYVLYTSGSTGRPKGVEVPHGAVLAFFAAMDRTVGCDPSDRFLAATSVSFDISVLEIFWTLARGARVVLLDEAAVAPRGRAPARATAAQATGMDFSLFYFSSDASDGAGGRERYRLLLDGARVADREGFVAVWTPERHFHEFGGLYPNPSVTGAAVAAITERVAVRAGSVVLPLHHPVRVAEEWAVVDNLSDGRVGLAFASGWHADDFVFRPDAYEERKRHTVEGIDTVRRLWRGEAVELPNGAGETKPVRVLPRPVQEELPVWLTAAGSPETFAEAGRLGANVLTHLLGQDVSELTEKIAVYRRAWEEAGHDATGLTTGTVTLMLHTFVGDDREAVRELVRGPFTDYLRSSFGLVANLVRSLSLPVDLDDLSDDDLDGLLEFAFDRYVDTSSLFGDPTTCAAQVARLEAAGVDEIACLIDFGVDVDRVLDGLGDLAALARRVGPRSGRPSAADEPAGPSLAEVARASRPTLFQATPSLMAVALEDRAVPAALQPLRAVLLGGEAVSSELARRVRRELPQARLVDVYGPTETTVWSAAGAVDREVDDDGAQVSIGRPLAGETVHLVDPAGRPVPPGMPGELSIGGAGVVRGYLGRPALTAERFVPDPWSTRPGARLYRTGDRARHRSDGRLDFLGRLDHQVKVRGHRIELGEVEAALASHPAVAEAVAGTPPGPDGQPLLAAWVVAADDRERDRDTLPDHLLDHLRRRLPAPLVPSSLVLLDRLPLTPNGKVDRNALAARGGAASPGAGRSGAGGPPRTELERQVAGVWAEVLDLAEPAALGRDDDFFRLGGHSLLAARLGSALERELGVDLPLREVFARPTVAGLAAAVEGRGPAGALRRRHGLRPRAGDGPPPLSPGQERLWFLDRLEPGNPTYNDRAALALAGPLDRPALARALAALVARHEVLRSRFPDDAGRPVQAIDPPARAVAGLPVVDLAGLDPARRAVEADRVAVAWARRPFDLAAGRLLRPLLVAEGHERHRMVLVVHHIVSDGWSLGLMLRDVAAAYRQTGAGQAPLEVQYGDWAARERERLADDTWDDDLAWWSERLKGAPPLLELPTDRPRPPVRAARGGSLRRTLAPELADRLRGLAAERGASLFAVLVAGLSTLLARITGRRDLVLGTPVAGRGDDPRLEQLVGLFVNTVALRVEVEPTVPFGALVESAGAVVGDAVGRGEVPFDRVLDALGLERSVRHTPVFQVAVALQSFPLEEAELAGVAMERLALDHGTVKFDWDLSFEPRDDGSLELRWGYSTALFDPTTAERHLRRLVRLLAAATEEPERPVGEIDLLSPVERHQMLAEWGTSPPADDSRGPVPRLVLGRAAESPDAWAAVGRVAGAVERLTFRALAERSAALAGRLRSLGVGPESPVAVLGERRPWVVVAAVAVARSGGVYLPLDPELPPERLATVLRDATRLPGHPDGGPVPVVTTRSLIPRLEAVDAAFRVVAVAATDGAPEVPGTWESPGNTGDCADLAAVDLDPDRLAYVIHTSGSTGSPKGVMVPWRGLLQRVLYALDEGHLAPGDRFLFNSSLSFDVSLFGLLGTLAHGATPVLSPPGAESDADALVDLLAGVGESRGIDYAVFTPALLGALAEHPGLSTATALSTLASGGEAMAPELPAAVAGRLPGVDLYNRYGPTETSIYVTSYRCRPRLGSWAEPGGVVPIGRPTAGARLAVVGPDLAPVPAGSVGELVVGGSLLARGYLGRPAATAEVFVPDPFSASGGGERLYRTGDLVRWRSDGELLFVGRRDAQVKLRGFRVELDEVAAALADHPAVAAAAAHLWTAPGEGADRLVGYLVPATDTAVDRGRLEDEVTVHVRTRLPEWMVPARLVVLDELPLTAAGKLDRRALPRPDVETARHRQPRGATEVALAEIWSRVLGVERVGADDNFFSLGGDSITSIRVVAQAREAGFEVEPRDLFQAQTVAELARRVSDSRGLDGSPTPAPWEAEADLALAGVELSAAEMDDLLLEMDEAFE